MCVLSSKKNQLLSPVKVVTLPLFKPPAKNCSFINKIRETSGDLDTVPNFQRLEISGEEISGVSATLSTYTDICKPAPLAASYFEVLLWGVGGALVESTPFVRRIMCSTPALAAT